MKILFQGDSITDAGRDRSNIHDLGRGYPKYTAEKIKAAYPDADIEFIDLGISGYLTVIATATLASIGTAGIPSVGLVTLSMVFASVGIPVEAIALIMGVDRILDMMRTAVNITGDAVVTTIVAHQNKSLDKAVFNSSEVKEDVPELTL